MRLWLSKQANGLFLVSKFKPVKAVVRGTNHEDLYVKYGDPIGYRNICLWTATQWYDKAAEMPFLSTVRVNLKGESQGQIGD